MKITIAIPAHNEELVLKENIYAAYKSFCSFWPNGQWEIVISENASSDGTAQAADELASELGGVRVLHSGVAGKGLAIRRAWESVEADVYIFFDADLSTDLIVAPLMAGEVIRGADIVVGSRYLQGSKVTRSPIRKIFSRIYRMLLFLAFRLPVRDAPCGAKAVSARVIGEILPQVKDDGFFFDSELIIRAADAGLRVKEVPVTWTDRPIRGRASKVSLVKTSFSYIRAVCALFFSLRGKNKTP